MTRSAFGTLLTAIAVLLVACDDGGPSRSPASPSTTTPSAVALWGLVLEQDHFPVEGATVTLAQGQPQNASTTTDWRGNYRLQGVTGPLVVRAEAPGFLTQEKPASTTGQVAIKLDFVLELAAPHSQIAGLWQLTLAASSGCSSFLPQEARERKYAVTISQDGRDVKIEFLGQPPLPDGGNAVLYGRVTGDALRVEFSYDHHYYGYTFLEKLGENAYFTVIGAGVGTVDTVAASGTITGEFVVLSGSTASAQVVAKCEAPDHRFRLTKR